MLTLYEVIDPDCPGYRMLFETPETAKTYWIGVCNEYGSGMNIQRHDFVDVGGLLAFLGEDLREWNPLPLS